MGTEFFSQHPSTPNMLTLTSWIYSVLTGCFLHASTVSCSPTGIYETDLNLSPTQEWIYGHLIIFAGLTGALLLLILTITISSIVIFDWVDFVLLLATSGWFAHLVIYAIYVKNLYRPSHFPYHAYVASQTLDQLTDLFIVVGLLTVVYGRWGFRFSMGRSFFRHKWILDTSLTILHAAAIGCTTAFLAFSAANPEDDNKHMQWLASHYVYTIVYILVVANAVFSTDLLKARQGAYQVRIFLVKS